MKKSITLLKLMLLILSISFTVNMNSQILIPQNNIQVEKCGSDQIHQQLMQTDPAYAARALQYEAYIQSIQNNANKTQSIIYKVPVVVNVMHKGEAIGMGSNVSDDAIKNAIKLMNQMFRKEVGTVYNASGVDVEIEYVLAVRDPSGNCTNGINRISMTSNSAYMSNGVDRSSSGGISDAALKATYSWDQNLYYNIWLVYEIDDNEGGSGVQGYAYFASSHGAAQDGAVILASNFTSGTSTTAAHEIGHSLNLYHTFQGDGTGSTCPADICGTSGDCCADTPPHKRSNSDCVSGTNSCTGTSTDLYIHNYMDYSSDVCQNMLTANQKTRMSAAVSTTRASFLGSDNGGTNMGLVPVSTAGVDFESSASILCGTSQSVSFVDKSSCIPNSYLSTSSTTGISHLWTITNGVNTYTSTAQNPTITFNNSGTFNVTLQVTNAHGTTSATKTGMVVVSSAPTIPCTPTSSNEGNYAQTISNITFNTINSSSSTLTNAAYTNLACSYNTIVTAGSTYQMSISANSGGSGAEVFEVYINYNNDSDFADAGELVFSGNAPNSTSGTYTTNITIPGTATTNSLLRMRVIGETGTISSTERTCGVAYLAGDVEDYGVYIIPAGCSAPTITGTSPASRCGTGTLSIGATASAGTVNWYTAATGGTAIASGTTFTTPSLTTTTTYYVDATNAGCTTASRTSVTASVTPTIVPSLAIALTSGTNPKCSGTTSTFTTTPTNGGTTPLYQWKVNGANVGTNSTTYTTSTITNGQAVTCVLTSNATCAAPTTATSSAVTMTVNTTVVPSIIIGLTSGSNPSCSGGSITFTATPTNGGTTPSYQWQIDGTNAGINSSSFTTSSLNNGENITCILTSNATCATTPTASSSAITMTISGTVAPAISISISSGSNPMCVNASTTFSATSTNGGSAPDYQWQIDGTNVGTNSSTFTTSSLNNGENVTCILTSNSPCASTPTAVSSVITVTTSSPPTVNATASSTNICSSSTSTLTASGATSYLWNTGASTSTISVSPTVNTTYSVTGTTLGCSNTDIITITVNALPTVSIAGTATLCTSTSSVLSASGALTYLWNTSETTTSINVSPSSFTTYTVTGTDANGCSASDTHSVNPVNCSGETATTSLYMCNLNISNKNYPVWANSVTGAQQYRFSFYNPSAPTVTVASLTSPTRSININAVSGLYYGNVYKWTVAVNKGIGFGPESSGTCTVNINEPKPTVPCGKVITNLSSPILCTTFNGVSNYKFTLYNDVTNAVVAVKIQTSNYLYLNQVPGIAYGNTYKITVEAEYNNGSGLVYSTPSSSLCTVITSAPMAALPCGNTYTSTTNPYTGITAVTGVSAYKVNCYNVSTSALVGTKTFTNNYIYIKQIPGMVYGTSYYWTIQCQYNNGTGLVFGPESNNTCMMTWGAASPMVINQSGDTERLMSNQEDMDEQQPFITVYPNPNNGSFNVVTNKNMSINIINEFGQIVRTQSLNQENNYEINIKDLANGIYFLIGQTQGNNVLRQKIIVHQ